MIAPYVPSLFPPPPPQGLGLSGLVDLVLQVDSSILVTALLSTTTVFLCFAGAALLSKRRSYLYLGGILSAGITGEPHVPFACSGTIIGNIEIRCVHPLKSRYDAFAINGS